MPTTRKFFYILPGIILVLAVAYWKKAPSPQQTEDIISSHSTRKASGPEPQSPDKEEHQAIELVRAQRQRFDQLIPRERQQEIIDIAETMFTDPSPRTRAEAQKKLAEIYREEPTRKALQIWRQDFARMLLGIKGWSRSDVAHNLGHTSSSEQGTSPHGKPDKN